MPYRNTADVFHEALTARRAYAKRNQACSCVPPVLDASAGYDCLAGDDLMLAAGKWSACGIAPLDASSV